MDDYHRWYDPAAGRWLAPDPEGFSAGDRNLERYVGNSPADLVDPLGLAPPTERDQMEIEYWKTYHNFQLMSTAIRRQQQEITILQDNLKLAARNTADLQRKLDAQFDNYEDALGYDVMMKIETDLRSLILAATGEDKRAREQMTTAAANLNKAYRLQLNNRYLQAKLRRRDVVGMVAFLRFGSVGHARRFILRTGRRTVQSTPWPSA